MSFSENGLTLHWFIIIQIIPIWMAINGLSSHPYGMPAHLPGSSTFPTCRGTDSKLCWKFDPNVRCFRPSGSFTWSKGLLKQYPKVKSSRPQLVRFQQNAVASTGLGCLKMESTTNIGFWVGKMSSGFGDAPKNEELLGKETRSKLLLNSQPNLQYDFQNTWENNKNSVFAGFKNTFHRNLKNGCWTNSGQPQTLQTWQARSVKQVQPCLSPSKCVCNFFSFVPSTNRYIATLTLSISCWSLK